MKMMIALTLLFGGSAQSEQPDRKAQFYRPNRCGAVALLVICRWHQIRTSLDELTELSGSGIHGTSVAGILQAATAKGLRAKAFASSMSHLRRVKLPAIVDYPAGHFSVVLKVDGENVVILDPPSAHRSVEMKSFQMRWGGNLVEFSVQKE